MTNREDSCGKDRSIRTRSRAGDRWRGIVFAAGVAFHQIVPTVHRTDRNNPPYVYLLPEDPRRFSERECVGDMVLTMSLDISDNVDGGITRSAN